MARGKYHEWLTDDGLLRIESWASDGLTNEDISSNMGIHRDTLNTWCKKYSDINDALKKGREPVVRKLENAIVKKALGYEYEETTTEMWVDDDGNKKQKVVRHKKQNSPDTSALIFLLKNYKPNKYRNYNDVTRRKIEAEAEKLEADAKLAQQELDLLEREMDTDDSKVIFVDTADEMQRWLDEHSD
jgi:hypothetical protein